MIKNISNLGDAALYCDFGIEVNKKTNAKVIKYFKTLRKKNCRNANIIISYNKLIISYDLNLTKFKELKKIIEDFELKEILNNKGKIIKIPICCDKKFAPDINNLEKT